MTSLPKNVIFSPSSVALLRFTVNIWIIHALLMREMVAIDCSHRRLEVLIPFKENIITAVL